MAETSDVIWVLELYGTLLSPLMARNALKSNVTWSSYPFVPPTGASGFFVDLLEGPKWYERNDNTTRHLHDLPEYQGVYALGAFPDHGRLSRKHFRAHLGSLGFNYEAYVWQVARNEGKKLAVVEELYTERLRFVLVGRERDALEELHRKVRGKVAPITKKGCVQLEYTSEPKVTSLTKRYASGSEEPIALVMVNEIGSFPLDSQPYLVPCRSEVSNSGIVWFTYDCVWGAKIRFRSNSPIYASDNGKAIGELLLQSVCEKGLKR